MKSIQQLHQTVQALLIDIKLCKRYAASSRANREFRAWAHWMNIIKAKKHDLRIVAVFLHIALHAYGHTRVIPVLTLREELTTVGQLERVVARTCPDGHLGYPML